MLQKLKPAHNIPCAIIGNVDEKCDFLLATDYEPPTSYKENWNYRYIFKLCDLIIRLELFTKKKEIRTK